MSCCTIFNNPFYKDIKDVDAISSNDTNFPKLNKVVGIIRSSLKSFTPEISGIWFPVVIKSNDTDINSVNIFRRSIIESTLDPCNCNSINEDTTPFEEQVLDCEYCNKTEPINNTIEWSIRDENTGKSYEPIISTKCSGANDVRMYPDDYLTKLPSLSNINLTGNYDFKYLDQFPAASNKGLGFEELVSIPIDQTNFFNLNGNNIKLCTDWRIQERIGETQPNAVDSYYEYIDDHNKAYNRYLIHNKTCGNFILLSPNSIYDNETLYPRYHWLENCIGKVSNTNLTDTQLPSTGSFTIPYGFKNTDHYNIFSSGNNKIGSYWKWNYTSGILCWYRHADRDLPANEDKRLIPGVDLYISPGDVFYANNQGPEPIPEDGGEIKPCPSGIKLIAENKTVSGVIPPESEFVYISQNIYSKVKNIFDKLHNLEIDLNTPENERKTPRQKLELACLLGTCPDYDEITVDLLLDDPLLTTYPRNDYKRIKLFDQQMLKKSIYGSANDIGIIKNKKDLLNTLVHKYGCYILFKPSSNSSLTIGSETKESNIVFDLDFEPVIDISKLAKDVDAAGKKDCSDTTITANFYYDQRIEIGSSFLETRQNRGFYNQSCSSGEFKTTSAANITSLYFSEALLDSFVYSTGSISLEHIYLRPVSYDLALRLVGESLCSQEQYSLCNKSLSVKYNNDLDLWGTPQERKEGKFEDDSVKLSRGYAACYFNPNINLCAFHRDGGVYFDSNTFGNNKLYFSKGVNKSNGLPKITFTTKDVGIKLYSLKIDKLRDQSNPECKTLPLDQTCKCFNLYKVDGYQYDCDQPTVFTNRDNILYTPNVSTNNGPKIKSYGDYTTQELISKFGKIISIPNHPSPRSELVGVNKIIDPLNPYECYKYITFNLPNYVYTKWELGLDKYITKHTDIWVKVSDPTSLLNPTLVIPNEDDEFEVINNPNYRRYNTEVKLNESVTIFDKQTDILFRSDETVPDKFFIEMTNPFLYALLEKNTDDIENNKKLYSPFSCSLDQSSAYAATAPYSYNLTFTFEQKPRKHLLMYKMYALKNMGTLTRTFFHPNSGIRDEWSTYGTSLIFNKDKCYQDFLYEQELFLQGQTPYNTSGVMYRGDINLKNQFILDNIDKLKFHKKLRLYIKSGNTWYEYMNPHLLGFYNEYNNNLYPGMASYFEYTNFDKPKALLDSSLSMAPKNSTVPLPLITKPSTLIPASAKVNTKFSFINNSRFDLITNNYPDIGIYFVRNKDNPRSIIINSIRPYFLFDDKQAYVNVKKIEELNSDDQTISAGSIIFEESTQDYWKYHDGPKNDKYSYELLSGPSYFDNKFSNLHFNINVNTLDNDGGIINDSLIDVTPTSVVLYDKKDPALKTKKTYSVIGKFIIADIIDEHGNVVSETNPAMGRKYVRIQTALKLDLCEECSIEYQDGYMVPEEAQLKNLITIYQNLGRSLYGEFSPFLANRTVPYQTKWGDLLYYDFDKNFDLNNAETIASIINREYPFGPYKNIFDSVLINQLNTNKHKLLLTINQFTSSGQPFNIIRDIMDYDGELNHALHQKYNIGSSDQYYDLYTSQYENFIPLLDLCFIDRSFKDKPLFNITSNNTTNNVRTSGDIYISGVRGFTNSGLMTKNPKDYSYFVLSLDKNVEIKPVLFDKDFYHHTLRVDDTYFPLLRNELVTESSLASGCNTLLTNDIDYDTADGSLYFSANGFDKLNNNLNRPYFETATYCDSNVPGDPCYVQLCRFKVAGRDQLKAEYQHLTHDIKKLTDIADSITEYSFGIDEGLYNFAQGDIADIPYIQRFEIPPEDALFNELSDPYGASTPIWNSLANLERPIAAKYSYINSKYQTKLSEYANTAQSDLVKNTDILANEMLFRSLYGSKQYINTETIKKKTIEEALESNYSSNPWSYVLQYSDSKTTPDKIYDFIPYDYDKNSDQSKRKISGTISINGTPSVGKSFSVLLDDKTLNFTITEEDGDVFLVANAGGSEVKKIIGQKFYKSEFIFATELNANGNPIFPPQPPDQNTTITRIDTCVGEEIKSWSIGSYYTAMEYTKIVDDQEVVVNLVEEFKKCIAGAQPFCGWGVPAGVDSSIIEYYTIPGGLCPTLCPTCSSRGYADGIGQLPNNCTVVASTVKEINYNGLSRGVYTVNDELFVGCPPRQGGIQLSPSLKIGSFDDLVGGVPVLNMINVPSCGPKTQICKPPSCHSLEATDKFGKVFEVKRRGIAIGINGVGSPCECRSFSFGYCTPGQSSCNECIPYEINYPKVFDYEFQNQYATFKSTGHVLRDKAGEPIVHNGNVIPQIGCGFPVGLDIPGNPSKYKSSERCFWIQCTQKNPSYGVYKSVARVPIPYEQLCPLLLTTITYDNNITTINLFGNNQSYSTLCIKNEIRDDCPLIEITLPDNTFTINDSINSECSMCDVEPNKVTMDEQHPEWEILTETRTAILGVISFGNDLNTNTIGGKGVAWVDKTICGEQANFCCHDNCFKGEAAQAYQCGSSAPDSWPWNYALNCELNGSPNPSFAPCIHNWVVGVGTGHAFLVNTKIGIGFENTSSNKPVAYAHKEHWKDRMTIAYNNTQACKNNNDLEIEDIVEGVVPGSCSELKFAEISFPATAFRPTLDGGESTSVSYVAEFAYYTYEYRRPKTIEDALLGDELNTKCSTINPIGAYDFSVWSAKNMAEKYQVKTKDCQTIPVCYDTTVQRCDENNFCCRVNKTDAE